MPSFNFTISTKKRKISKNYEILEKDIKGIIHIDIDGNYTVHVGNNIHYKIHPRNYDCSGSKRIFLQGVNNKSRTSIILKNNTFKKCYGLNPTKYLPFAVGLIVKGNIVVNKYSNIKYFNIKNFKIDYNELECHQILEFYRNNINIINENIMKKRE